MARKKNKKTADLGLFSKKWGNKANKQPY